MAKWEYADIPESVREKDLVSRLLALRGIDGEDAIADFLEPQFNALYSPLLFREMTRAVNRILAAKESGETVAIVGDYDADGITATALLCRLFATLGMANPVTILPHRLHDGYGLSPELVERAERAGASLVITVDNGISGQTAASLAKEKGIDLIITDHHRPLGELPHAVAILDPWCEGETYPFRQLAGVGMAYKLAAAVLSRTAQPAEATRFLKWAFDLVAIGTIADVVPLRDENRIFVKLGLSVIPVSKSPGVRALAAVSRVTQPMDASMVAYRMAPRLNAAGRLSDPALALDLLLETDEERANLLAKELDRINGQRQGLVTAAMALARLAAESVRAAGEKLVIVRHSSWEHGIVGLIAGKLCEEFSLPVIVLSNKHDEGIWVASCRSLPGFDVAEFIGHFSGMFLKGGGHAAAGGFSIAADRLALFEEEARSWAAERVLIPEDGPALTIDCILEGSECSLETVQALTKLAPFGAGNPEPVFAIQDARVESCRAIGENGRHRQLRVTTSDGCRVDAVAFGVAEGALLFTPGEKISLAGNLGINQFNGQTMVRFLLLDALRETQKFC